MIIPITILLLLLVLSINMIIKNERVYALRSEILTHALPEKNYFIKIIQVHDKYSYNQMLFSLRRISSFRTELIEEVRNIKKGR